MTGNIVFMVFHKNNTIAEAIFMKKKNRTLTLRLKMALTLGISMVFLLLLLGFLIVTNVKTLVVKNNNDLSMEITTLGSNQISEWLNGFVKEVNIYASSSQLKNNNKEEIETYLFSMNDSLNKDFDGVLFLDSKGESVDTAGNRVPNLSQRDYYREIVKNGKDFFIGDPVLSARTNEPIVVIAQAVKDYNNKTVGLLAGVVKLDTISEIIKTLTVGKEGYAWLLDQKGTVIAHPNPEYVMKLNIFKSSEIGFKGLEEMGEKMTAGGAGSDKITSPDGTVRNLFYNPVSNSGGWSFGLIIPEKQFLETSNQIMKILIIIISGILVIVIMISFMIAKSIANPINVVKEAIVGVSKGDLVLSHITEKDRLKINKRSDEIGDIGRSTADMLKNLIDIVTNVKSAADQVLSGSDEISSSAQKISQGSTEQAASAEEVSSSIEEMNSIISQNTENAINTEDIARQTSESAVEGGDAVESSVKAIKNITEKIDIVGNIARQTNLLALNAAIEAARAGEAGKGFAVVASEVRKLAERSQKAANEIVDVSKSTVVTSINAGEIIGKIVPDIRKTAELIKEITSSSKEQSSGADQISRAMIQLDNVIQDNAAASEEMASMAEELSAQSKQLTDVISFFKVE